MKNISKNTPINKKKTSKKYEFTGEMDFVTGLILYRIRALRDFGDVKAGDLGGYIENESNLSHKGNCWVYDKARVFQNARVSGNAKVKSFFVDVCGNARIYGNAIFEGMLLKDNAKLYGNAHVSNAVVIEGNAKIYDNARVTNHAHICDGSRVFDDAVVCGALISGDSYVHSAASLTADDHIWDEAYPEFGSEDDYYRHEYYADCEGYYDDDSEYENDAA
ncbi:phage related protein [Bartonella tribocorum]|uniref:phage related protein n=1 Tax=Bartonella tribocorum TaxID=85701 RepID=UPI00043B1186|nr:phage related protein [Bartonella tribocorum]CDO48672.1 phage related protein [Bartonella tribocorum]